MSTALRVSLEMGCGPVPSVLGADEGTAGRLVGYQVRYENAAQDSGMAIKFMTDGILLKEVGGA